MVKGLGFTASKFDREYHEMMPFTRFWDDVEQTFIHTHLAAFGTATTNKD